MFKGKIKIVVLENTKIIQLQMRSRSFEGENRFTYDEIFKKFNFKIGVKIALSLKISQIFLLFQNFG